MYLMYLLLFIIIGHIKSEPSQNQMGVKSVNQAKPKRRHARARGKKQQVSKRKLLYVVSMA